VKLKEFDILLDIKRPQQDAGIEVVQADKGTSVFNIRVMDGFEPYDLTGVDIEIAFNRPDGNIVVQDKTKEVSIINPKEGRVRCLLLPTTITKNGRFNAEVRIKQEDNVLTTTLFSFYCRKAIFGENVIDPNDTPALQKLQAQIGDINNTNLNDAIRGKALTDMIIWLQTNAGKAGVGLNFVWQGTRLGVKREDETEYIYVDLQGAQGEKGERGEKGEQGERGEKGEAGTGINIKGSYNTLKELQQAHPVGQIGDTYVVAGDLYLWDGTQWLNVGQIKGEQGERGEQGIQGTQGERGLQGEQGIPGKDGLPGNDGKDGQDGKSTYQIWLSQGNTGTEEDFLNSLKGKDGEGKVASVNGKIGEIILTAEDIKTTEDKTIQGRLDYINSIVQEKGNIVGGEENDVLESKNTIISGSKNKANGLQNSIIVGNSNEVTLIPELESSNDGVALGVIGINNKMTVSKGVTIGKGNIQSAKAFKIFHLLTDRKELYLFPTISSNDEYLNAEVEIIKQGVAEENRPRGTYTITAISTTTLNYTTVSRVTLDRELDSAFGVNDVLFKIRDNNSNGSNLVGDRNFAFSALSTVLGADNISSTFYNVISGQRNVADTGYGIVVGSGNNATGGYGAVFGTSNISQGAQNFVAGANGIVIGDSNICGGSSTQIRASNTFASGVGHRITDANYSGTMGANNHCERPWCYAFGYELIQQTSYSTVVGRFNDNTKTYMFSIGNGGGSANRKNIFGVTEFGETKAGGSYSSSGADYAELTEWVDGNPNNEKYYGRFVQLTGEKISLADSKCKIFGVISSNPAIIGDSHHHEWKGKYLLDEWGRPVYEEAILPAITEERKYYDEEGNETIEVIEVMPERKEMHPKLNPDYDYTKEYIPREERKEFAPVGMLGKIIVLHDGTAKEGRKVFSNDEGIATDSPIGYDVMKVLSNDKALISFHQEVWTQEQLRKIYNLIGAV